MKEQIFIAVAEAADMLGISKSHAYKIVRDLNREMKAMGYLTIAGRINKSYFLEKTCYSPDRSLQLSKTSGNHMI